MCIFIGRRPGTYTNVISLAAENSFCRRSGLTKKYGGWMSAVRVVTKSFADKIDEGRGHRRGELAAGAAADFP